MAFDEPCECFVGSSSIFIPEYYLDFFDIYSIRSVVDIYYDLIPNYYYVCFDLYFVTNTNCYNTNYDLNCIIDFGNEFYFSLLSRHDSLIQLSFMPSI